jgi:hypothetical protein
MLEQQRTQIRLKELLAEEDYPGAIQLLLECQQAAVTYNHFTCISELSKKLQETLENAEEQLDVALSKVEKYEIFICNGLRITFLGSFFGITGMP